MHLFYNISSSWPFPLNSFEFIFYGVTVKTIFGRLGNWLVSQFIITERAKCIPINIRVLNNIDQVKL